MPKISHEEWQGHQEFEKSWHGQCLNTFGEEVKQLTYANRMGIELVGDGTGRWPVYDFHGQSVVDIGGGPASILLKAINADTKIVVDPCQYPKWVYDRYELAGILVVTEPAEDYITTEPHFYDLSLCYNCLQHTIDPEKIIRNMQHASKKICLFEWIDTPPAVGHPHTLTEENLNKWLGTKGTVEEFNGENGLYGKAYYASVSCS